MLDSLLTPIHLPKYHKTLAALLDERGDVAYSKYYFYPYRPFYRKKLYMMRSLMDKGRIYKNILDFGSGSGIFTTELARYTFMARAWDKANDKPLDSRARFELIVCGSVLELVDDLDESMAYLRSLSYPGSQLIMASPTDNLMCKAYFKLMGDTSRRHSPSTILKAINRWFDIVEVKHWAGLYFACKAVRK